MYKRGSKHHKEGGILRQPARESEDEGVELAGLLSTQKEADVDSFQAEGGFEETANV